MKLRIVLLAIGALCLAALTQCTVDDDGDWMLPTPLPTSTVSAPVSPIGVLTLASPGLRLAALGVGEPEVREMRLAPVWGGVPVLKRGDAVFFECQLREAGGGGVVRSQQFLLRWGERREILWLMDEPGEYEAFCRAERNGQFLYELFDTDSQDCAQSCGFVFLEGWQVE